MPLFDSRGLGTTVVVDLLILFALGFAVVAYVEWSSGAAVAKFMSATESSVSEQSSAPVQTQIGRTGCPVGKRELPTHLIPLPKDRS